MMILWVKTICIGGSLSWLVMVNGWNANLFQYLKNDIRNRPLTIQAADTIKTDERTFAEIEVFGTGVLILPPLSEIIVQYARHSNGEELQIQLESGALYVHMPDNALHTLELITNSTSAMTQDAIFGVTVNGFYWVKEGGLSVLARQSGQLEYIGRNMFVQVSDDGSDIIAGHLSGDELDRLTTDFVSGALQLVEYTIAYQ